MLWGKATGIHCNMWDILHLPTPKRISRRIYFCIFKRREKKYLRLPCLQKKGDDTRLPARGNDGLLILSTFLHFVMLTRTATQPVDSLWQTNASGVLDKWYSFSTVYRRPLICRDGGCHVHGYNRRKCRSMWRAMATHGAWLYVQQTDNNNKGRRTYVNGSANERRWRWCVLQDLQAGGGGVVTGEGGGRSVMCNVYYYYMCVIMAALLFDVVDVDDAIVVVLLLLLLMLLPLLILMMLLLLRYLYPLLLLLLLMMIPRYILFTF